MAKDFCKKTRLAHHRRIVQMEIEEMESIQIPNFQPQTSAQTVESTINSFDAQNNHIYNDDDDEIPEENMPFVTPNATPNATPNNGGNIQVDDLIACVLLNFQLSSQIPDSKMESLLKIINKCGRMKGLNFDIVPDTYYMLSKKYDSSSILGVRYVCKNESCSKLLPLSYREKSRKYAPIVCDLCGTSIDPVEETYGPRGFYVKMNPKIRLQSLLEHSFVVKKINFSCVNSRRNIDTYGTIQSGRIYNDFMQDGDLSLTLFVDGVKAFRSSSKTFHPAMLSLNELSSSLKRQFLIVAAVYFGSSKPNSEFMIETIKDDLNELSEKGIDWTHPDTSQINNTKIRTLFAVFDSQEKYSFLNILSPSGHKSCPKCYIESKYSEENSCMYFPFQDQFIPRSTDHYDHIVDFLGQNVLSDVNGIKGSSPLRLITDFDWIEGVTIDLMHALDLGIVARLAKILFKSQSSKTYYSDGITRSQIDTQLKKIKISNNFPRTIRALTDMENFKASEWNNFLIYIFPIVMKDALKPIFYDHLFLLCYSVGKLTQNTISDSELSFCNELLKTFVYNIASLYGSKECTHNSHLLLHLKEVIQQIGSLTEINAYIFENYNGLMRNLISGPNNLAKQISRKDEVLFQTKIDLLEANFNTETRLKIQKPFHHQYHSLISSNFPSIPSHQFSTLTLQDQFYSSVLYDKDKKNQNHIVSLGIPGSFFVLECFFEHSGEMFAIGKRADSIGNFKHFSNISSNSTCLELSYIHQVVLSTHWEIIKVQEIGKKCLCIEQGSKIFFIEINNNYAF